jgi:hypothetical protein
MSDHSAPAVQRVVSVRGLSSMAFGQLGVGHIAYVRPVLMNGAAAFAIHAADGTQMAVAPDAGLAFAAIRQHEMEPLSLH